MNPIRYYVVIIPIKQMSVESAEDLLSQSIKDIDYYTEHVLTFEFPNTQASLWALLMDWLPSHYYFALVDEHLSVIKANPDNPFGLHEALTRLQKELDLDKALTLVETHLSELLTE